MLFSNADDKATTSVRSGKSDLERERLRVFEAASKHWGNGVSLFETKIIDEC